MYQTFSKRRLTLEMDWSC